MTLPWTELVLRLALAAIFGAVIGVERERKEWAAGLRTHMMVCVGSALMMLVSSFGFSDTYGMKDITLDPSRVAAQIISGIGFIGAGTILFRKPTTVLGLTTASGLWTVAGIGMATGGGMYLAASITTVLALIILWGLHPVQRRISSKFHNKSLTIVSQADSNPREIMDRLIADSSIEYTNFMVSKNKSELVIEVKLLKSPNPHLIAMVEQFSADPEIKKISWHR